MGALLRKLRTMTRRGEFVSGVYQSLGWINHDKKMTRPIDRIFTIGQVALLFTPCAVYFARQGWGEGKSAYLVFERKDSWKTPGRKAVQEL